MTQEIKMLPLRQKQIVELIITSGFIASDFDFNPYSHDWFDLHYRTNRIFFIKFHNHKYSCRPGQNGEFTEEGRTPGWDANLQHLKGWLSVLKENLLVGNPWQELKSIQGEIAISIASDYEEMFKDDERRLLQSTLDNLVVHLESMRIETAEIRKDITHIMEMSTKISKKDVVLLFLGFVTNWLLTGFIPPESSTNLWNHIKTYFGAFWGKLIAS